MKPEAPLPSEIALQAACALQRVWFGFQRGRGLKPGPPLCGLLWACVKPGPPVPSEIALQAARIVQRGFWVSVGARVETWAAPVWVVVGVCETWASPVWVVAGVCETWASRACFMAPGMGSFGEAGVVWVSAGACGV